MNIVAEAVGLLVCFARLLNRVSQRIARSAEFWQRRCFLWCTSRLCGPKIAKPGSGTKGVLMPPMFVTPVVRIKPPSPNQYKTPTNPPWSFLKNKIAGHGCSDIRGIPPCKTLCRARIHRVIYPMKRRELHGLANRHNPTKPTREQLRLRGHRSNSPRQSSRPVERGGQRRSH
jgi:hypothetical protein